MIPILVYGSLRKNSVRGYNFQRFGSQVVLACDTIRNFQLYSRINGSYPAALYTGNLTDKIVVEVHNVTEATFEKIKKMEVGAGYKLSYFYTESGFNGQMFFIDTLHKTDTLVESGNWE